MKRLLLLLATGLFPSASALTLQDNDTVVFLGNTVVERAQKYGHFETALTLAANRENLKFRNLGWSGDTVFGHARSYFGPPSEGFRRLTADLTELKPEVVILCYGAVAAFDGEEGLADFLKGYETLLAMIKKAANPREIVLVSPPPAESLPAPMPKMDAHNENLARYAKALGELAAKHDLDFADFFTTAGSVQGLTDNGIHLTAEGYRALAPKFLEALGMSVPASLESPRVGNLRDAIVAKNKLFFFRWRPANETYLRLFRKHEQGQNVKELPMFDPLIENAEKDIEALRTSISPSQK
mgnify:CR=1 FL=1